jgi:hypothetical protein
MKFAIAVAGADRQRLIRLAMAWQELARTQRVSAVNVGSPKVLRLGPCTERTQISQANAASDSVWMVNTPSSGRRNDCSSQDLRGANESTILSTRLTLGAPSRGAILSAMGRRPAKTVLIGVGSRRRSAR